MRRPGPVAAVLLLVAWFGANLLGGLAATPGPPGANPFDALGRGLAPGIALACLLLLLAAFVLRWPDLGLAAPRPGTAGLLWLPFVYIALFLLGATLRPDPAPPLLAATLLANAALVGLSEELMFRGFLHRGLRARLGPWPAILVGTLLFGAMHTANALTTGLLSAAVAQSVNAVVTGLCLMGLRVRSGSLWPSVAMHTLWNWSLFLLAHGTPLPAPGDLPPLLAQLAPSVALLPLGAYGLWLLWDVGRAGDGIAPGGPHAANRRA